jgi:asparagine synthase (glutamine-hydrolysing)
VVLSEAAQAELCVAAAYDPHLETAALYRAAAERAGSDDWLAQLQAIDAHVYLPDDILTKADRMSMAHSLEARVPYLDTALVELAARLPSDAKLRRFSKKWILKRALAKHVPSSILQAKKRGFNVPVASWLRGELHDMVADVLSPTALRRVGLFEPAFVQRLIAEHDSMRADHSRPLWTLLVFMNWYEMWRQTRTATVPSHPPVPAATAAGLASRGS